MASYDQFILDHPDMSGEAIARELGLDGGTVRRRIRQLRPDSTAQSAPQRVLRGIAVFDLHYPSHEKRMWQSVLDFTADFAPDVFVFGGDNLDLEVISHWLGDKRRPVEGKRLKEDYRGFTRDVLDPLADALPEDCRRIWHYGNHEAWVEQYIDCHPEVEGFLEIENNIDLAAWEKYEYGQVSKVGKLHFTHGNYVNQHHALKTVQVYHRSVVYGHVHTFQAHTEVTPMDSDSHTAMSIGCACSLNPHYAKNRPNAWLNQFAVFYVYPSGNFDVYPVTVIDGHFIAPTGKEY